MDSGFFDMLHDPSDHYFFPVGDGVNVDLDRILQKLVDQNRVFMGCFDREFHILFQLVFVIHDFHGPSPEHIRGTDNDGKAYFSGRA